MNNGRTAVRPYNLESCMWSRSMTNLEALQSLTEYENEKLFAKVLLDHNIEGSEEYTSDNEQALDICLADIYMYLASHPDFRDGNSSVTWSHKELLSMRRALYDRHGLDLPEHSRGVNRPSIDGTTVW